MARRRRRHVTVAAPEPPFEHRRVATLVGAGVVLAAAALYFLTAARDVVFGDTPELTTVALTLGVAHPPGYPLFTMLGWVLGQLPVGPLPFRIALLSAACHAATVGVVYAATYRFARSVPAAAVAAAALASSPVFWRWSLVAEVFPLNDLLSAAMLFLVALWHERPERASLLVAGALVGGLGMSDHQTIGLLAPAVLYVMWRRRETLLRRPRILGAAAAAFAVGLLPYFELLAAAARRPPWSWSDLQTPGDLIAHALRLRYGTGTLVNAPQFAGGSAVDRLFALIASFDPLQALLLVVGVAYAWRMRRWYTTYLLIAFAISGPAFATYANINVSSPGSRDLSLAVLERFFLLPHVVVAPLAGFAVVAAGDLAEAARYARCAAVMPASVVALVASLAIVAFDRAALDQSQNHVARTYIEDLFATLKPNAILLSGGDAVLFPAIYFQRVEGARLDVVTVALPLVPEDWYTRELRRQYPDLVVAADRYGPGRTPFRDFLAGNRSRPQAIVGSLPDESASSVYGLYPRGLTLELRDRDDTPALDDIAAENDLLLRGYRPPSPASVAAAGSAWERLGLAEYAAAYERVGAQYERAADGLKGTDPGIASELYGRAAQWYSRALNVAPDLAEAKQALQRVRR